MKIANVSDFPDSIPPTLAQAARFDIRGRRSSGSEFSEGGDEKMGREWRVRNSTHGHGDRIVWPMPLTLDSLAHEALGLPPDRRVALAYRLLVSVDPAPEPGAEAAWEAEIAQRIARYDAGTTMAVSAGEVFARLREIAPGE